MIFNAIVREMTPPPSGETWVINDSKRFTFLNNVAPNGQYAFTNSGTSYVDFSFGNYTGLPGYAGTHFALLYRKEAAPSENYDLAWVEDYGWEDQKYRTVTFDESITEEKFLYFLNNNAVKQS